MERIEVSILESSAKMFFHCTSTDLEIWVEHSVSPIQHIENRKKYVLLKYFSPVLEPTILHTVVFLHFNYTQQKVKEIS